MTPLNEVLVEVDSETSFPCSILQAGSVQGHSSQHLKRRLSQTGKQRPTKLRDVGSEAESLNTAANLVGSHESVGKQWPGFREKCLRKAVVTFEILRLHGILRRFQGTAENSHQTPDALAECQPSVLPTHKKLHLYPSLLAFDEQACADPPSPNVQAI